MKRVKLNRESIVTYVHDHGGGRGKKKIIHATYPGFKFIGYGPHEKAAIRSLRDQIRNGVRAPI